ncbi:store-operated calcium entry-associated regulatory factor [Daphnia magna]|uniref:Store-operated calcium entry-associated regulatory factor n=1 Tax=Daphnia magna TaxID=35525 RepID=A0A0N8CV36_9CRUS|nr:store-operated calcium entry-associated regulatory factor [Daphnia magna]KZS11759.1 Store-operated calcium entry-associated regulatory factor [Daphnia magna]
MKNFVILLFVFCCCLVANVSTYGGSSDSVRLSDIQVLTLYHGKMTAGRRSSPVQQLKCVGGTAGCKAFTPKVVQCYNRGWDGNDIQWECKTDMDNAYRFGDISVSCEGYSYADDPYILKGSCGLEYTLDLTKEGYGNQQGHDYYGSAFRANDRKGNYSTEEPKTSLLGNLILLVAVGLIIYALYRTCIAPPSERVFQSSTTSDDFGGYPGGDPYHANAPPPPAGFRSEFAPNTGSPFGASCGGEQAGFGSTAAGGRPGSGAGGFWTGAAAGGLLGYMFGNRGNARTSQTYRTGRNDYSDNAFWGGTSRGSSGNSPSSGMSSTGTRTASGFGGTTRR